MLLQNLIYPIRKTNDLQYYKSNRPFFHNKAQFIITFFKAAICNLEKKDDHFSYAKVIVFSYLGMCSMPTNG